MIPYKKQMNEEGSGAGTDVIQVNGISAGSPAAFLPSPTMRD